VTVRSRRKFALYGLSLLILLGLQAASVQAQTGTTPAPIPVEQFRGKAIDLEKAGKWEEALHLWCKIVAQNKQNDEAHSHLIVCLRRMMQSQRQVDESLRAKVLSLSHTQSLALYGEVLTMLHIAYVEKTKVEIGRLFQQGVDEFLLALNDQAFRKTHMPEAREAIVRKFQTQIRDFMNVRAGIATVPDAVELLKQIAATAKRDLHLSKTSAVVLEFIGGACNSLDEYTSYLSPSDLAAEMSPSEASVVDTGLLKEGIGYFRITHFRETTAEEVDAAIVSLKMMPNGMNLKALVMDLRGNPGGHFPAAIQVVERFVPEGVIVSTQGRIDDANKIHTTGGKMNVIDLPLIVLVDSTTASAAEVLAAAFRDHQRATLIGTATYGKGSIQRVLQFATAEEMDESGKPKARAGGIRITFARFLSPNGQGVNGVGIAPHIVEQDKARQLEMAIEQASRYVSGMAPR
jgi:C-terminal processing protease CtpA/Prc